MCSALSSSLILRRHAHALNVAQQLDGSKRRSTLAWAPKRDSETHTSNDNIREQPEHGSTSLARVLLSAKHPL